MSPRKRDERLKRVYEAKVKEEQREEEKKKKIEQKMAQIDEKNDKVSNKSDYNLSVYLDRDLTRLSNFINISMQRHAEEKAKKKVALKRQEELELKKKLEEEAKKKKIQQAVR